METSGWREPAVPSLTYVYLRIRNEERGWGWGGSRLGTLHHTTSRTGKAGNGTNKQTFTAFFCLLLLHGASLS